MAYNMLYIICFLFIFIIAQGTVLPQYLRKIKSV